MVSLEGSGSKDGGTPHPREKRLMYVRRLNRYRKCSYYLESDADRPSHIVRSTCNPRVLVVAYDKILKQRSDAINITTFCNEQTEPHFWVGHQLSGRGNMWVTQRRVNTMLEICAQVHLSDFVLARLIRQYCAPLLLDKICSILPSLLGGL